MNSHNSELSRSDLIRAVYRAMAAIIFLGIAVFSMRCRLAAADLYTVQAKSQNVNPVALVAVTILAVLFVGIAVVMTGALGKNGVADGASAERILNSEVISTLPPFIEAHDELSADDADGEPTVTEENTEDNAEVYAAPDDEPAAETTDAAEVSENV